MNKSPLPQPSEPRLRADLEDGVAVLRMNHPAKRNVLSAEMLDGMIAAFAGFAGARAVIIRAGETDSVWSAGFDIAALSAGHDPLAPDGKLHALFNCVADFPAPVIAMLHGSAWGGACDLVLRCDIVIADPTASLAFTPARIGLPYDRAGVANAAARAGAGIALEMFATAQPVAAERAYHFGLLNHLVPEAELEDFTYAMARRIAANAPLAVAAAKRQLRQQAAAMVPTPPGADPRAAALASLDYREGVAAFLQRRPPRFTGA
jgi:methylmalonyl-CoA decarboxylase